MTSTLLPGTDFLSAIDLQAFGTSPTTNGGRFPSVYLKDQVFFANNIYFKFTAQAVVDGRIWIPTLSTDFSGTIQLYDSNQQLLASSTDSQGLLNGTIYYGDDSFEHPLSSTSSSVYYIKVNGSINDHYGFGVYVAPIPLTSAQNTDNHTQATALSLGTVSAGAPTIQHSDQLEYLYARQIHSSDAGGTLQVTTPLINDETDFLKFSVEATGSVTINTSGTVGGFILHGPAQGNIGVEINQLVQSGQSMSLIAGDYYIEVIDTNTSFTSPTIRISSTPDRELRNDYSVSITYGATGGGSGGGGSGDGGSSAVMAFNGHTYQYVSFNGAVETWAQASAAAAAMGGYLATITSQSEKDFITNNVVAGHLISSLSTAFIGASDAGHEGNWQWTGGPEAGTTFWNNGVIPAGQYANWGSGEPNNSTGNSDGSENYAVIEANGTWTDVPSSRPANVDVGFVVEFSNSSSGSTGGSGTGAAGTKHANDFNGDGFSDVLFRNNTSGDTGYSDLHAGNLWNGLGASSTAYTVVGTGDFNGDGFSDVLFRNNTSGDTGYSDLNAGNVWHGLGGSSTAYSVVGAADFNGDGFGDVLYRNAATGDTGYSDQHNAGAWHGLGAASTSYTIVGTGDFNGDGFADILWRNNTSGDTGTSDLHNAGAWHSLGASSTAYNVVGTGDFNGDGFDDVLWRSNTTGDTGYTDVHANNAWHGLGGSSTAYKVVGTGDYNGDHFADILYQNITTGDAGYSDIHANNVWHGIGAAAAGYLVVA